MNQIAALLISLSDRVPSHRGRGFEHLVQLYINNMGSSTSCFLHRRRHDNPNLCPLVHRESERAEGSWERKRESGWGLRGCLDRDAQRGERKRGRELLRDLAVICGSLCCNVALFHHFRWILP